MLKAIKIFFISLGVLALLAILIGAYIWIADPFDFRKILPEDASPIDVIQKISNPQDVEVDNVDKNPLLTEDQEAQLESIGVDPAKLPTEITPEMEGCLLDKLGEERSAQIIKGDAPSTSDFLKASSCF